MKKKMMSGKLQLQKKTILSMNADVKQQVFGGETDAEASCVACTHVFTVCNQRSCDICPSAGCGTAFEHTCGFTHCELSCFQTCIGC